LNTVLTKIDKIYHLESHCDPALGCLLVISHCSVNCLNSEEQTWALQYAAEDILVWVADTMAH